MSPSGRFDEEAALGSALLARMDRIARIPGVLIQGRRDISGPAVTTWRLHRSWPAGRLVMVEEDGHSGPGSEARMQEASDRFVQQG